MSERPLLYLHTYVVTHLALLTPQTMHSQVYVINTGTDFPLFYNQAINSEWSCKAIVGWTAHCVGLPLCALKWIYVSHHPSP